jgi:hypothetical protein
VGAGGVPVETIRHVVEAAQLPPGEVYLLLGDNTLDEQYQAVTVARALMPNGSSPWGLSQHMSEPWDCGVIVGERWTQRQGRFPAYFAYLLGHEFGHTATILTDVDVAVFENLVLAAIREATDQQIQRYDDLPYEVRYDQFGLAVVEAVYGREQFDKELETIIEHGLTEDVPRARKVLGLEPRLDVDGVLKELAEFTRPYRSQLLKIWARERAQGNLVMADRLDDLEGLWPRT